MCEVCGGRGWLPRDGSQHGDACPECYVDGPATPRKQYNGPRSHWYAGKHIGSKGKKQPGGFVHRKGHH